MVVVGLAEEVAAVSAAPEPAVVFPLLGIATFGILYMRNRKTAKDSEASLSESV